VRFQKLATNLSNLQKHSALFVALRRAGLGQATLGTVC